RPRRRLPGLDDAIGEPRHRRTMGAVDLESDEVVAIDPRHPAHVDMGDDTALEAEGGVGGVCAVRLILLAVLAKPLRNIRGAEAAHALDLAEEIVEHVAPVADHVQNDAAAVLAAIIPGRPLRLLPAALDNPLTHPPRHP